tara:strand:+ start:1612 stop:1800 length:189 start_codon:yes stop_codon:yes gene_type:complete
MKNLLELQKERDSLRAKLQSKIKLSNFDKEFDNDSKLLRLKDKQFFAMANKLNVNINKFGRA